MIVRAKLGQSACTQVSNFLFRSRLHVSERKKNCEEDRHFHTVFIDTVSGSKSSAVDDQFQVKFVLYLCNLGVG